MIGKEPADTYLDMSQWTKVGVFSTFQYINWKVLIGPNKQLSFNKALQVMFGSYPERK